MVDRISQAGLDTLITFGADAAAQAALGFPPGFRLVISKGNFQKIAFACGRVKTAYRCAGFLFFVTDIRFFKLPLFSAALFEIKPVDKAMDAFSRFFASGYRLHYGLGTVKSIAACKDPVDRGLESQGVGLQAAAGGYGDSFFF